MRASFWLVLVAVSFSATGEILLKSGVNRLGPLHLAGLGEWLLQALRTPYLYGGFACVATGAAFWIAAISRADLSWAYPMLALGYVIVLVLSAAFLGERITLPRLIGTALIAIGVVLVARS